VRAVFTLLVLSIILVRLVALDADPPAFLSWSTGIYTDEGYYTNDARSAVLFHHWAIGDFHSAVLTPLLYLVQLAVFHIFGVGLIQVRAISVGFGLLTVLFFALGLRRLYGQPSALAGALFLGLFAPFVFYNRLALIETPEVFFITLAFFLTTLPKKGVWAGIALGIGAIVKSTALLAAPALLIGGPRRAWPAVAGLAAALILYAALWYGPNHAALGRMNGYYAWHQYLPHSIHGVVHNLWRGLVTGAGDGVLPYLVRFAPVTLALALVGLSVGWRERREGDIVLTLWFLVPIGVLLFLSYTPSRTFVLFWPALAGLAARGFGALYRDSGQTAKAGALIAVVVFLITSGWEFGMAWRDRTYTVRDDSQMLQGSGDRIGIAPAYVCAGQMAPELSLDNTNEGLLVQPGLANDDHPVERYYISYILVTRSTYWNTWWKKAYPPIITPDHRIMTLKVGNSYLVDVYRVH
jgi:4-amino-4-deoxy-L-arabinose transferase-like glycosyltransferase